MFIALPFKEGAARSVLSSVHTSTSCLPRIVFVVFARVGKCEPRPTGQQRAGMDIMALTLTAFY